MNGPPYAVLSALKAAISFLEAPTCCVGVTRNLLSDVSEADAAQQQQEEHVVFAQSVVAHTLWPPNMFAVECNTLCQSGGVSAPLSNTSPPPMSSLPSLQPLQLFTDSRRNIAHAMFSISSSSGDSSRRNSMQFDAISANTSRRNSAQFDIGVTGLSGISRRNSAQFTIGATNTAKIYSTTTVSPVSLSANGDARDGSPAHSPPSWPAVIGAAAVSRFASSPLLRDLVHADDLPALLRALDTAHGTVVSTSAPVRLLLPTLAGIADCWSLATVRRLVPDADCWIVRFVERAPHSRDPRDFPALETDASATATVGSVDVASTSAHDVPVTIPLPRPFHSLSGPVGAGSSNTVIADAAAAAIPMISKRTLGVALGVGVVTFRSAPSSPDVGGASRAASPDPVSTPPFAREHSLAEQ